MKRNILSLLILTSSLLAYCQTPSSEQAAPSSATQQPPTTTKGERTKTAEQAYEANVQLMRADIRSERKKVVAANLPLTETEAVKFWPVYDRYIGETIKVNDARYALIKDYAQPPNNDRRSSKRLHQALVGT